MNKFQSDQTEKNAKELESRLELMSYLFKICNTNDTVDLKKKLEEGKSILQASNNYRLVISYNNCIYNAFKDGHISEKYYVCYVAEVLAYTRCDQL